MLAAIKLNKWGYRLLATAAFAITIPAAAQEILNVDPCLAGPYVLSFTGTSAKLNSKNIAILDNAIAGGSHCGHSVIIEALPSENASAALQRARLVETLDYIQAHALHLTDIRLRISSKKSRFIDNEYQRDILIWFGPDLPE